MSKDRRRWMPQLKQSERIQPSSAFSIQALNRLDDAYLHWQSWSFLPRLNQKLIFSRDILTVTPRSNVYQLFGYSLDQLSQHNISSYFCLLPPFSESIQPSCWYPHGLRMPQVKGFQLCSTLSTHILGLVIAKSCSSSKSQNLVILSTTSFSPTFPTPFLHTASGPCPQYNFKFPQCNYLNSACSSTLVSIDSLNFHQDYHTKAQPWVTPSFGSLWFSSQPAHSYWQKSQKLY